MSGATFIALVVAADLAIWVPVFLHERKEWGTALAAIEANVAAISLNVMLVIGITFLR